MKNTNNFYETDVDIDLKIKEVISKSEIVSSLSLFVGIMIIIILSGIRDKFPSILTQNLISLFSGIVIWGINAVSIAWSYHKVNKLMIERYVTKAIESVIKDNIGGKDDNNN